VPCAILHPALRLDLRRCRGAGVGIERDQGAREKSVAFFDNEGSMLPSNARIATEKDAVTKLIGSAFATPDYTLSWHANKVGVARSGELGYTSGTHDFSIKDTSGKTISDKGKYLTGGRKRRMAHGRCCSTCTTPTSPQRMTDELIFHHGTTLVRRLRLTPGEAMPWHRDPCHRVAVVLGCDLLSTEYRDGGESQRDRPDAVAQPTEE